MGCWYIPIETHKASLHPTHPTTCRFSMCPKESPASSRQVSQVFRFPVFHPSLNEIITLSPAQRLDSTLPRPQTSPPLLQGHNLSTNPAPRKDTLRLGDSISIEKPSIHTRLNSKITLPCLSGEVHIPSRR